MQQRRDQEEPRASGQHVCHHEQREIEPSGAGGDGDDLVGDWRQALHQDDPQPVFLEFRLEPGIRRAVSVQFQDGLGDLIEHREADQIAQRPARHARHRADRGELPGRAWPSQRHRHQEGVGGDWEEAGLGKGDQRQPPCGVGGGSQRHDTRIGSSEHAGPFSSRCVSGHARNVILSCRQPDKETSPNDHHHRCPPAGGQS